MYYILKSYPQVSYKLLSLIDHFDRENLGYILDKKVNFKMILAAFLCVVLVGVHVSGCMGGFIPCGYKCICRTVSVSTFVKCIVYKALKLMKNSCAVSNKRVIGDLEQFSYKISYCFLHKKNDMSNIFD